MRDRGLRGCIWDGMAPAPGPRMKTNIVLVERTVRLGVGMLLLASPLLELRSYPFNLLGLVLIVTGALGYCPLYRLLPVKHAH